MIKWPSLALMLAVLTLPASQAQEIDNGFIFAPLADSKALPGTQPDNHASTLVEIAHGDLLAAWFGGTKEGAPDVAIYGARQHNGAWSAPVELARDAHFACWNPVLFHSSDGRLWLYYKVGPKPSAWVGWRKWSDDGGRTWSGAEQLPDGILGPIKDKPLVLRDGTIVSGSSVEAGKWTAWVERSQDQGRTWSHFGPITVPDALDIPDEAAKAASSKTQPAAGDAIDGTRTKIYPLSKTTVGIIQPTIVPLEGHHLRLYARGHTQSARIAVADSLDDGKTWSQAHLLSLPNPNSGIDSTRLKDGRIVLIFNNSYNTRTPLNLAVSLDGDHFQVCKTLEDAPGQYSYPAIIQAANGDLLMTYSWQRKTIKFVRLSLRDLNRTCGAGLR
jgi:predicted neuraminidase